VASYGGDRINRVDQSDAMPVFRPSGLGRRVQAVASRPMYLISSCRRSSDRHDPSTEATKEFLAAGN
jgi:hypothetical protein